MSKPRLIAMAAAAALTLAASAASATTNLVVNPGFETGDFIGWTVSGDGISIDSVFPNTGTYDAAFSAASTDPDPGVLSQSIATTVGASYDLSFALMDEAGVPTDAFTASLGAFSQTVTGDEAPAAYTVFSFVVPGSDVTSNSSTLSFTGTNDFADWNLDDVSVSAVTAAVPEPAEWALLALGVGMAGFALRRRKLAPAQ
ncbi:MAG: PEP-CTERM sorting domain-containing protein [Caulobacteraceae bacterium]